MDIHGLSHGEFLRVFRDCLRRYAGVSALEQDHADSKSIKELKELSNQAENILIDIRSRILINEN